MCPGLFIIEVSGLHSGRPHSVGLLWKIDGPVAETVTWQHTTLKRDRHPCPRRDSNPQSKQASAVKLQNTNNILGYIGHNYDDSNEADKETFFNRSLITESDVTGPRLTDVVKLLFKLSTQISTLVNLTVHSWSYSVDITARAVCSEGLVLMSWTENTAWSLSYFLRFSWLAECPCVMTGESVTMAGC